MAFSVMHTQWGNAFSTFQSELRVKFAHHFIIKDFEEQCTFWYPSLIYVSILTDVCERQIVLVVVNHQVITI